MNTAAKSRNLQRKPTSMSNAEFTGIWHTVRLWAAPRFAPHVKCPNAAFC